MFLILLLVAAAVRVCFAVEFAHAELALDGVPTRDMHHHVRSAGLILAGDPLLRGELAFYQELFPGFEPTDKSQEGAPLVHAPLYSYFLASSLWLTGSTFAARLVQIAMTLVIPLLTWASARMISKRESVALLAFVLVAFHPTTVFFSAFLLRTTLYTVLLLGFVLGLQRYLARTSARRAGALGGWLGLLHLMRSTLPLCAPPLLLALWFAGSWRRRAQHAAVVLGVFLLVVSPLMLRNALCETPLLQNEGGALHGSLALYNHPGADGLHQIHPSHGEFFAVLAQGDGSYLSIARSILGTFPSPAGPLQLLGRKLRGFWSGYEAPNNVDFHTISQVLGTLKLLPISSTVLLALGLFGALASLRPSTLRRAWPVYAGLAMVLAGCLLTASLARYRAPAFPFLAVLAALGLQRLKHSRGPTRTALLALLSVSLLVAYPIRDTQRTAHGAHGHLAGLYLHAGDLRRASLHAEQEALLFPIPTSPPPKSPGAAPGPEWDEFFAIQNRAYQVCVRAENHRAAQAIRDRLRRALGDQR